MARSLLISLLILLCITLHAQTDQLEVEWADSVITWIKEPAAENISESAQLADSASRIYDRAGLSCKYFDARVRYASFLGDLGAADTALAILLDVEGQFSGQCDSTVLMQTYVSYTYLYLTLDDLGRVDSLSQYALSIWNDDWGKFNLKMAILNNWSISKAYQGDLDEADRLFRLLYSNAVRYESPDYETKALVNLGSLKGMIGQIDSAYVYLNKAAARASEGGDDNNLISILINLASVETERKDFVSAHALLDSAAALATRTGNLDFLGMVQYAKSDHYADSEDFESAYTALLNYQATREKFLDEERVRAVSDMQAKYESEKKTREIQGLKIDNLDAELRNATVTRSRNGLMFGGICIILLAIGLFSRLRHSRRSRIAIQKEKDISEELLLNILPAEVAEELKEKGAAKAQLIDHVTVLFTDFKDFTSMAEKLSPEELVTDLNASFSAFDRIMAEHGIEKIKTIGDAYMAAGGLPVPNDTHVKDVMRAAFKIRDFIAEDKARKIELGIPYFEIRIGIHTGPVVAGIVGVKKFQYDIWGDTVNIARRMESSGDVGRVNISEASYNRVKESSEFTFTPRGKVVAKGKGEMMMFYAEPV